MARIITTNPVDWAEYPRRKVTNCRKDGVPSPILRTLYFSRHVVIMHCELIVYRVQPARFIATAVGHVLNSGPRKARGLHLASPSRELAKRPSGLNWNDADAAAEPTLVARRSNALSSSGRCLVRGSFALVVVANSLGFAFDGALLALTLAGYGSPDCGFGIPISATRCR